MSVSGVIEKVLRVGMLIFGLAVWVHGTASAQQPPRYSHKQLQRIMDSAATASDYQRLATYFHYQELKFRAEAQRTLDESSRQSGKYPMATKTISRSEVDSRAYKEYLARAEENSVFAAKYDNMLMALGVKPEPVSSRVLSVRSLKTSDPATTALH